MKYTSGICAKKGTAQNDWTAPTQDMALKTIAMLSFVLTFDEPLQMLAPVWAIAWRESQRDQMLLASTLAALRIGEFCRAAFVDNAERGLIRTFLWAWCRS